MRILHLTTFLQGGAGRVIADLALAQRLAGHEPSIVASRTGAPGYGNYDGYLEELAANGIPVDLVDSMFTRDTAANLAVVRFLEARYPSGDAPDVIHTHAATPSLVALVFAAARRRHITLVQTMHGWGVMKTPHQTATDVALLNLVDRVAVPSQQSAATIAALGVDPSRKAVVPYGVSHRRQTLDGHDLAAADAMERAKARGALVVACVGTIGRRKNQALLLDAVTRIQQQVPTFCLFVGDGDVDGLRLASAEAQRSGEICVRGYSRSARTLAARADLLVLPSTSEGQPISVLEAFCDRTLVAVSDIPELAELVEPGVTGLQFAAGDARSLASTLVRVSRMSAAARQDMRDRARERYLARFTTPAMSAAYLDLYDAASRASWMSDRSQETSAA